MQREANTELAVSDLQRRLIVLGFHLGDEADKGLFGEKTAAAITTFKETSGLGYDDVIDQNTWTALKDASMQMGDRLLFLHMPHFRGRDVAELQGALSSMGFSCRTDSSFGPETEGALRDFQGNMHLETTGILDEASLESLLRLRHIWEGKRGFYLDKRALERTRTQEILESVPLCVYGIDEQTRDIANRISNLARATTRDTRVVSASSLLTKPGKSMLLVGLVQNPESALGSNSSYREDPAVPRVSLEDLSSAGPRIREAIRDARLQHNRLVLSIDYEAHEGEDAIIYGQQTAACILDLLCKALAEDL